MVTVTETGTHCGSSEKLASRDQGRLQDKMAPGEVL